MSTRRALLLLGLLLVVSYGLRVALARQGGAYFWLDESQRFSPCVQVVDAIRFHGPDWHEVGDVIAVHQHHIGFFLVGIPLAALFEFIGSLGFAAGALWIPPAMLSVTSVVAIALVYAIARRSGASTNEALLAAFLMACANSMFYSTRHVLPYESGLAAGLGVLWLTLGESRSVLRSYLIGVAGNVAYLVYYGYLSTVLVVLVLYVFQPWRWRTTIAVALGFLTPMLALHAFTLWWAIPGGNPFLIGLYRLMQGADQGGFEEGWRVPWIVLWHVEHGILLAWIAGAIAAAVLVWRGGAARRHVLWLVALAFLYGQMAIESSVVRVAVVEGRFARQLVPFFCLVTAAAIATWAGRLRVPRAVWALALVACVAQAGQNFATAFRLWFPTDVQDDVVRRYGDQISFAVSVEGPGGWEERGPTRYVLLNTIAFLYPAKASAPVPAGRVLERYDHPLQFVPYQYEVFDPEGRAVLQSTDISMRVVDTGDRALALQ